MSRWWLSLGFVQRAYWRQAHRWWNEWTCDTCPRGEDLADWQRKYRRICHSVHIMGRGRHGSAQRYRRAIKFGRHQERSHAR